MKQILLILSVLVFSSSFGQVDNYDLLTKNIESSNIKSITKFRNFEKFPNGERKFKLEFNEEGQLVAVEEYEHPMNMTKKETYLLYIGDGTNAPLSFYFEYEEYK